MEQIPDAPWIRKAEQEGTDYIPPVYCPCCGEECTTIYADIYGNVFACNWCLMEQDAWEWAEEQKESEREEFEEHKRVEE